MIAEHTFVTTLDWSEMLTRLRGFLQVAGFRELSVGECHIEAGRGRRQARAGKIRNLPHVLRVEFDRGRVTAATEIRTHDGRDRPAIGLVLVALLECLETFVTGGQAGPEAVAAWEALLGKSGRVRSSASIGCLIVVVGLVVAIYLCVRR